MRQIFLVSLVLFGLIFAGHASAKEKDDYLFLVTITKDNGRQERIYTDFYLLSATATASSVTVGNQNVGSGEESCDSHMKIAVKGGDGVWVNSEKKEESLNGVHRSWDIAWNDKLIIQSQKYNKKVFVVTKQGCPFPLVRMVPNEE